MFIFITPDVPWSQDPWIHLSNGLFRLDRHCAMGRFDYFKDQEKLHRTTGSICRGSMWMNLYSDFIWQSTLHMINSFFIKYSDGLEIIVNTRRCAAFLSCINRALNIIFPFSINNFLLERIWIYWRFSGHVKLDAELRSGVWNGACMVHVL